MWEGLQRAAVRKLHGVVAGLSPDQVTEWLDAGGSFARQVKEAIATARTPRPTTSGPAMPVAGVQLAAAAAVLGIGWPTKDAVDKAFKAAAFKVHPDRGGTAEQFQRVKAAHLALLAVCP
jgi:hypothetical protein